MNSVVGLVLVWVINRQQALSLHGMVHICCIMCPRDLPDMYTHTVGPNGPQAWMYISGKSLRYMIQLLLIILL